MRNEKKYYFVYKTTNLKNNKFYIGVHETYNMNDGYLGSGKVLRNSVNYHGKENFKREILEFCVDKVNMYQKEKELVTEELISDSKCMNLVIGGVGFINDERHREVSQLGGKATSLKLKNDPEFRKLFGDIASKKFKKYHSLGIHNYNTFEGRKHKEESKQKMSESMKGKGIGNNNSQFGTCWITNEKDNRKINKGDLIPEGWRLGRKLSTA